MAYGGSGCDAAAQYLLSRPRQSSASRLGHARRRSASVEPAKRRCRRPQQGQEGLRRQPPAPKGIERHEVRNSRTAEHVQGLALSQAPVTELRAPAQVDLDQRTTTSGVELGEAGRAQVQQRQCRGLRDVERGQVLRVELKHRDARPASEGKTHKRRRRAHAHHTPGDLVRRSGRRRKGGLSSRFSLRLRQRQRLRSRSRRLALSVSRIMHRAKHNRIRRRRRGGWTGGEPHQTGRRRGRCASRLPCRRRRRRRQRAGRLPTCVAECSLPPERSAGCRRGRAASGLGAPRAARPAHRLTPGSRRASARRAGPPPASAAVSAPAEEMHRCSSVRITPRSNARKSRLDPCAPWALTSSLRSPRAAPNRPRQRRTLQPRSWRGWQMLITSVLTYV
eukprot:scaffold13485_cov110-Isochrysis_galbana.AAC.5